MSNKIETSDLELTIIAIKEALSNPDLWKYGDTIEFGKAIQNSNTLKLIINHKGIDLIVTNSTGSHSYNFKPKK